MKAYSNLDVYEATNERLKFIFDNFEQVVISFSGGKDSGLLLNLTLDYARKTKQLNKVAVYHMDYEAQYQETTKYVERTINDLPKEVTKYWVCLPIKAQCSTSMFQNYWTPWDKKDKDIWCRKMPKNSINEDNFNFDFDWKGWDYDFNKKFDDYLSKQKKTAFLIGIRAQESLHRFKAISKASDKNEFNGCKWSTKSGEGYNFYPIYDWQTEDIWIANAKYNFDYNHIYDLMQEAGVPINNQRVASPFNDSATSSLALYKALDPDVWYKLLGRVNGVNFTALYGKTSAMGWNKITKPNHFTWKQYAEFLLSTLPKNIRENYEKKLATSIKYWTKDGGALPSDVVKDLPNNLNYKNLGKPKKNRNYSKPYEVIKFKDYLDDVESKSPNLLPTYKRVCIAIMKNDTSMKTLGFGQTKFELEKRRKAIEKYRNIL